MIKTEMDTEEDKLMKIDFDLFTYNTDVCEINHPLSIDPDECTYDIEESENDGKRIDTEWEDLNLNDWLRIRFGEVSETARDKIFRDHWKNRFENEYDESEDFEDPDGCEESKENKILETIINKLHYKWFKGKNEDDDDLEGIIDYLKPTLYDGFIDSDNEEHKERKCRLLGMPFVKPPSILTEKVKVTRYSVGPGEV
nr:hypothetical protein [Tanacetum cinerariifolium]